MFVKALEIDRFLKIDRVLKYMVAWPMRSTSTIIPHLAPTLQIMFLHHLVPSGSCEVRYLMRPKKLKAH